METRSDINGGFDPQRDHQTTPPDTLESTSCQPRLQRSKTERQRHESIFAADGDEIYDDEIPIDQKFKLLRQVTTVKDDGTFEFEVPGRIESQSIDFESEEIFTSVDDESVDTVDFQYIKPMQIVILIVGTRGDVQPFIPIGKRLQDYGHRVRLATHPNFKDFVLMAGLEFYPLGGDPKLLASYMVRNKGFLPSGPSEILVQRTHMKEIIYSLLPACKEPDVDTGIPFKADAIIANRTAYAFIPNC